MLKLWENLKGLFPKAEKTHALEEPTQAPHKSYRFIPSYPEPKKGIPLHTVPDIYETQEERLINPLFKALGLTNKENQKYLVPVIQNYIKYVHLLPGSRADHHSGLGGLFYHGLDTALYAVKFSEGYMPYEGANPGLKAQYEKQWRVAVALAALLHDIGKPVTDMIISSLDGKKEWNPSVASLFDWGVQNELYYYLITYRSHRAFLHENISIIASMATKIVPQDTIAMITRNGFREIWEEEFLGSFVEGSNSIIRKIVLEADMASVKEDTEAQVQENSPAFGISTHLMFARVLKDLLEDHRHGFSWKLNDARGQVFYSDVTGATGDKAPLYITWVRQELKAFYKIVAQEREELEGFPEDIQRLSQVLADKLYIKSKENTSKVAFRRVIRSLSESDSPVRERILNAEKALKNLSPSDKEDLLTLNVLLKSQGLESLPCIQFLRTDLVFEAKPEASEVFFLDKTEDGFVITPENSPLRPESTALEVAPLLEEKSSQEIPEELASLEREDLMKLALKDPLEETSQDTAEALKEASMPPSQEEEPSKTEAPVPFSFMTEVSSQESHKEVPKAKESPKPSERFYKPDLEVQKALQKSLTVNPDGIHMLPKKPTCSSEDSKIVKAPLTEDLKVFKKELQKGIKAYAGKTALTKEEYCAKNGIVILKKAEPVTKESKEAQKEAYLKTISKLPQEIRELFAPLLRGEDTISSDMLVTDGTLYGFDLKKLWEFGLYLEVKSKEELLDYLLNNAVIQKDPSNPASFNTQIGTKTCLCLKGSLTEALRGIPVKITPLTKEAILKAQEGASQYLESLKPEPPKKALEVKPLKFSEEGDMETAFEVLVSEFLEGGGPILGKVQETPQGWESLEELPKIFERLSLTSKGFIYSVFCQKIKRYAPTKARKFLLKRNQILCLLKTPS